MPSKIFWQAIAVFLACFIGSCLVGLAVYGADIFSPGLVTFQFVGSGAIAGALAAAFVFQRAWLVGLVAAVVLLLFVAATRPGTSAQVLRDFVYVPTLLASVYLSLRLCAVAPMPRFGGFVFWGVSFAACHIAMFGILALASGQVFSLEVAVMAARIGGLVGVGVGVGRQVAGLLGITNPAPVH